MIIIMVTTTTVTIISNQFCNQEQKNDAGILFFISAQLAAVVSTVRAASEMVIGGELSNATGRERF